MLLRNKKTGKIVEREEFILIKHIEGDGGWQDGSYRSLAELNEEWEDYKPDEPLIKDEKIRKAIRAWAEANRIGRAVYVDYDYRFIAIDNDLSSMIDFGNIPECEKLKNGRTYDIDELCGEEDDVEVIGNIHEQPELLDMG